MSLWRQLTYGVRRLVRPRAAEQDIADEVQHFLDQTTGALVRSGLSPDDARRTASLQLGNTTVTREQVRAYGWENVLETILADLRYATRRLRANPAFTAVVAITLALGIGASTAIFSAVNPILFQPLPYSDPERVVMLWDHGTDGTRLDVTFGTYRELQHRARTFDALAVMKAWQPTMTGPAEPQRLDGQSVSSDYFATLGVAPALGRAFDAAEDRPGALPVVILGDGLWRRRFAGDRAIIGRRITLDDNPYTVVGVMPASFENVLAPSTEIWSPLRYDPALPQDGREWGHHLHMVARMRSGVTLERAREEILSIARTPVGEFARPVWASMKQGLVVIALQDDLTRAVKPALLAVLGAVLLVLTIACVNVTNLLLARGAQRRGELAMRTALGAERGRLVRQLLTESVVLAVIGGALGVVVAQIGIRALVALSPAGLPRVHAIKLDGTVLAFASGVTALIGVAVGLLPALQASRSDPQSALQQMSRRVSLTHRRARSLLVGGEVALAFMLLVGAGLLLRSLGALFAVAPGFDPSHLLTMQVQTSGHRFDDAGSRVRFFAQSLDAVRHVPGVEQAALVNQLPLSGDLDVYGVHFESSPMVDSKAIGGACRYAVSPTYFETMHIPLRRGRLLDPSDRENAPLVALLNESYARRVFPGRNPIGQRLRVGGEEAPWRTIVGVVGDVRQTSLAAVAEDAVYVTPEQWPFADNAMSLVVRAHGSAAALTSAVRSAVWSIDKDQPVVRVATMDDVVAASAAERRFALTLFEAFAFAALVLSATGIFGVLSGSVSERTREIGVRTALGATRSGILALVVRQGMTLTMFGMGVGVLAAIAASQALATLLFNVSHLDVATYAGVIVLLACVSVVACLIPAWRASRVDPVITLRAE